MTPTLGFRPDLDDTAESVFGVTRDGLSQLRRYWRAPKPGAVVVIVHGIAEHSGRYEHVARQLNAANLSVVGYDQRGHGRSGGRRGHVDSMDQLHDDLEDQLAGAARLGLPTFVLGHSMGGLVTTSYALTDRPQPQGLVLSAPALALAEKAWLQSPLLGVSKLTTRPSMKLGLQLDSLSSDPRVGEAYAADPLVGDRASLGLLGAMVETIRWVNMGLRAWSQEALVVHGQADTLVLPVASEPLGRRPGVERVTYETGRHELFNEPFGPEVIDLAATWVADRR